MKVKIKIIEAMTWVKKYLIAVEFELNLPFLIKIGIIDIRLISRPIQAIIHLLLEITNIALIIIKKINKEFLCFKNIKKRTYVHIWGMSPKAFISLSF